MAEKPKVKRRPRVTIDNNMLSAMANNNVYVKEFQFLSRLRGQPVDGGKKKGCGSCSRTRTDSAVFNAAKQAIASMSAAKKLRMKELLNADQLFISYRLASGKTEDRYF